MTRSGAGLALAGVLLVAASAGCSASNTTAQPATPGSTASGSSTSPGATAPPETPWEHELDNLQPDGTRTLESGLRLFAMAFGPIPGVEVATAAPGTVDSASPAVRVVRQHLAELPAAQRQAIEADLAVTDDQPALAVPASSPATSWTGGTVPLAMIRPILGALTYTDPRAEIEQEATRAYDQAASYFGPMPNLRIRFHSFGDPGFITFFNPIAGAGGVSGCDVILNTDTYDLDRFATRRGLTLDIVHCFQSWKLGSDAGLGGGEPGWAWEGPAEYILREIWPAVSGDAQAWPRYLTQPDLSLFARTYDAIGYYAQARAAGLDLGTVFTAVLTDGDGPGRFAAAGTATSTFLDTWASQLSATGWNDRWIFDGPGILGPSDAAPQRDPMDIGVGSVEAISQEPYSNHVYAVQSTADVVEIDVVGHARLGDGILETTELSPSFFCTTEKGCRDCADGSKPSVERQALRANSILAISGGTDGTTGTVSGHDLEEFCHQSPPPSKAVQVKDIRTVAGHTVTFADLLACDGPYGHWTGLFYGIDTHSRTMDFDMGGGSGDVTITTTPTMAEVPKGVLSVSGDVDVTIRDEGTTMVLSGTTDVVFLGPNGPLPPDHNPFSVAYQIEPADPGRCP